MSNELRIDIGDISIVVHGRYNFEYDAGKIKISSDTQLLEISKESPKEHIPSEKPINKDPYYDINKLRSGTQAMFALVELWKTNFDVANTEQPNRIEALQQTMMLHGDDVILLVKKSKGLTNCIMDLFPPLPDANEIQIVDHAKFYRKIACNMAQVSSISMPELSDYLEPHANYLKQEFWW